MNTFISNLSGKEFPVSEKVSARSIRQAIMATIRKDHPDFTHTGCLSLSELNVYREKYIADYL